MCYRASWNDYFDVRVNDYTAEPPSKMFLLEAVTGRSTSIKHKSCYFKCNEVSTRSEESDSAFRSASGGISPSLLSLQRIDLTC